MLSKQTAGRTQIGPGHFRDLVCGIFGRQSVGSVGGSYILWASRQNGGFFFWIFLGKWRIFFGECNLYID